MIFWISKDFRNKKKAYILKIGANPFGSERRKTKSRTPAKASGFEKHRIVISFRTCKEQSANRTYRTNRPREVRIDRAAEPYFVRSHPTI